MRNPALIPFMNSASTKIRSDDLSYAMIHYQDAFLRRVDSYGNTVWFKYIGEYSDWDYLYKYYIFNDSLIIGTEGYHDGNSTAESYGPWLALIRHDGTIVKQWKPAPDAPIDIIYTWLPAGPDKWMLVGGNAFPDPPHPYPNAQAYIALMDTSFQVIKVTTTDEVLDLPPSMPGIARTADGNYVGGGYRVFPGPDDPGAQQGGWLVKFDTTAEVLWSRSYFPNTPSASLQETFFGGVGVLSSGSLVAGGSSTIDGTRYCWIVKTTPDGCVDTLLCQPVGVDETVPLSDFHAGIRLYPNPAQNQVTVEPAAGAGPFVLTLIGPNGQTVLRRQLQQTEKLDVSSLTPGLYFALCRDKQGRTVQGKLLIAR
jgi:hypothetical protein